MFFTVHIFPTTFCKEPFTNDVNPEGEGGQIVALSSNTRSIDPKQWAVEKYINHSRKLVFITSLVHY